MYVREACAPELVPNDPFGPEFLIKGYSPVVKTFTRSITQEGTPDAANDPFISDLRALFIWRLTSLYTTLRSTVKAGTSMACSSGEGVGSGRGVGSDACLLKSDARELESLAEGPTGAEDF